MDRRTWYCLFTIAVLPIFGIGSMQLFAAEATGPTHDKIHPRIGVTAKLLWSIYLVLTISETILLMFGGMSLFDAVAIPLPQQQQAVSQPSKPVLPTIILPT